MTTHLRQRMIEDMQLRGLAERTQEAYVAAVRQLAEHYASWVACVDPTIGSAWAPFTRAVCAWRKGSTSTRNGSGYVPELFAFCLGDFMRGVT